MAASRAAARQKNVALSTGEVDRSLVLGCDGQRVQIALSNLVANAVKFVHPGGTVQAGVTSDGGSAKFTVQDDGPGISPEEQLLIFDRFYRGRGAGGEGAGLGLAIARSVARAHGGDVTVQSSPGRGSRFSLEIPRGT
jgi:signal transduction histidine kinase